MLSEDEIKAAKTRTNYSLDKAHHEHSDCIRIAYQWLDAQTKIQKPNSKGLPLKGLIEQWAGRYVSRTDVDVAAELHPDIKGFYPHFNISSRLTLPNTKRLKDIPEAFTQKYGPQKFESPYKIKE